MVLEAHARGFDTNTSLQKHVVPKLSRFKHQAEMRRTLPRSETHPPSIADMADDDGYSSEGSSPYGNKSGSANFADLSFLDLDTCFKRSIRIGPVSGLLRRPSKRDSTGGEAFTRLPACGTLLPEWPAVDEDLVASCKRQLLSFELDPTTLLPDVLCHLAMEMFVSAGLPAGLAKDRVRHFILAVRAAMLDNLYHNFYHVFDVMQTTNALATATGTMARLNAWERFALLSAALCHDLVNKNLTP